MNTEFYFDYQSEKYGTVRIAAYITKTGDWRILAANGCYLRFRKGEYSVYKGHMGLSGNEAAEIANTADIRIAIARELQRIAKLYGIAADRASNDFVEADLLKEVSS